MKKNSRALTLIFSMMLLGGTSHTTPLEAFNTWQVGGIDQNLNNATNWSDGIVPNQTPAYEYAFFGTLPSTPSPWQNPVFIGSNIGSSPTNSFFPKIFEFGFGHATNTPIYSFDITGAETFLNVTSPSGGPAAVGNFTKKLQTFTITHGATMQFDSAFADALNTGLVRYEVGDGVTPGTLNFINSANAGRAIILAKNSTIDFAGSTADNASIVLAENSTINFTPNAVGSYSTASHATITAINSAVNFMSIGTADAASIHLTGSSALTFAEAFIYNFYGFPDAGTSRIEARETSTVIFTGLFCSASESTIALYDHATLSFLQGAEAGMATIVLRDHASVLFAGDTLSDNAQIYLDGTQTRLEFETDPTLGTGSCYCTIAGNGTMQISGNEGELNFLATATSFSGTTLVQHSNFGLYAPLGGNVFIQKKGILSGESTVLGNLTIQAGGTIAPGDPQAGTILATKGNFLQASGSRYHALVTYNGSAPEIQVGGTATLEADTTLSIATIGNESQLPADTTYKTPIVHADGILTGTYTTVEITNPNPLVVFSLSYNPHNVYLTSTNALALLPVSFNEGQVATQLQTITYPTSAEKALLHALVGLPVKSAQHALDEMSGEQYTHAQLQSQLASQQFIQRLYNPLRSLITTDSCYDYACECAATDGFWFDGGFMHDGVYSSSNAKGFKADSYEFTIGAQTSFDARCTFGAALSYENSYFHYNLGGNGHANTVLAGLYGLYHNPGYFYVLADLVYGYSEQKVKRGVHVGDLRFSAHGRPEVNQGTAYVEVGIDYRLESLLIQPFGAIEGSDAFQYSFKEHSKYSAAGLLNLSIENKRHRAAHTRLGVHLTGEYCSCITVAVDLAWRYRLTHEGNALTARFQEFGDTFSVRGVNLDRSSILGAIDLSAEIAERWEAYAEGTSQWFSRANSYSILAGIRYSW